MDTWHFFSFFLKKLFISYTNWSPWMVMHGKVGGKSAFIKNACEGNVGLGELEGCV